MDYAPIEAFLIGVCGMTTEQAGWTTLREFNLKYKAHQEAEQGKWELARWQMFLALQMQPMIKATSKPKDVKAWITFPWEREEKRIPTPEDCRVTDNEAQQLATMLQRFKEKH